MVEAKLLRKKLKNGLIVDKWDLVTIIEKQQAEIEALKYEKSSGVYDLAKTLTDEEIWKLWQKHLSDDIPVFARAILRKAQEK